VVDNAASGENWEIAGATAVIRPAANLGFAAGCNAGIAVAFSQGSQYVLLLNNDTEVEPRLLDELLSVCRSHPVGVFVGPLICYYSRPGVVWSAGGAVDEATGACRSLHEGEAVSSNLHTQAVDYVSGCCLLAERRVIDEIGVLDERFYAYYEEVDWCARARRAGYQVWFHPGVTVWHKVEPYARESSRLYTYLMTRNRLLYLKARGAGPLRLAWIIITVDLAFLAVSFLHTGRNGRVQRQCRARAVLAFCFGRFGRPSI
jgi:GT2 family glycosyltransferase